MAASLKAAMQGRHFVGPVTVDCANGVGGPKLRELIRYLPPLSEGGLDIKVVNDDVVKPERLNHQVCASCKIVRETLTKASIPSVEQTLSKQISARPLPRMQAP